jgi:hypothetical protein
VAGCFTLTGLAVAADLGVVFAALFAPLFAAVFTAGFAAPRIERAAAGFVAVVVFSLAIPVSSLSAGSSTPPQSSGGRQNVHYCATSIRLRPARFAA